MPSVSIPHLRGRDRSSRDRATTTLLQSSSRVVRHMLAHGGEIVYEPAGPHGARFRGRNPTQGLRRRVAPDRTVRRQCPEADSIEVGLRSREKTAGGRNAADGLGGYVVEK